MTNKAKGTLTQILGLVLIAMGIISVINSQRYGVWASILGFMLFGLGSPLIKKGARIKQLTADELMEQDTRDPILLLRAFNRDQEDIRDLTGLAKDNMMSPNYFINKDSLTYEEKIIEVFSQLGPVVAIGIPNEKLQPLGAARTYVPDDKWKDKVIELAKKSSYILFIVDDSPSLKWEFEEIIKIKNLDRIILLMPPLKKNEITSDSTILFLSSMNILQKVDRDIVAITFDRQGQIQLIKSQSNNILKRIKELERFLLTNSVIKKQRFKNHLQIPQPSLIAVFIIALFDFKNSFSFYV